MSNQTADLSVVVGRLRLLRDELERVRQRDRLRVEEAERHIQAGTLNPPTTGDGMHELFQAYEERSFALGRLDALSDLVERLDLVLNAVTERPERG